MSLIFNRARLQNAKLAALVTLGLAGTTVFLNIANTWIEQLTLKLGYADRPILQLAGLLAALCVVAFVFFFFRLPGLTRRFGATAEVLDQSDLPARPCLITGVSAFSNGKTGPEQIPLNDWGPDRLAEAMDSQTGRDTFGNWQQNLRVLASLPGLSHVYVLENDREEFALFAAVMGRFFPTLSFRRIEDRTPPKPGTVFGLSSRRLRGPVAPNYEDFLYVTAGIDRAFQMICAEHHLPIHEAEAATFLDATPGTKTLSIISAIASVNRPILFVYCSPRPHDGHSWEVIGYDISMEIRQNQAN